MRAVLLALMMGCTNPAKNGGSVRVVDTAQGVDFGDADTDADADTDTDADADADSDTDTTDTDTAVPTCDEQLPADVIIVDSNIADDQDGGSYWVCAHKILSYSGTGARIYVENSADVVLNGTHNTMWMHSNSDIAILQDPNDIVHEPGAAINDESVNGADLLACPVVTFDLSLLGTGGC